MDPCWNRIGVQGDMSCPELQQYVTCRNCPVHAAAAVALLDTNAPGDYVEEWTSQFAAPAARPDANPRAVVVFRVESEWFGLPPAVVEEVTRDLPVHSLPHRRGDAVLGVTNIRGELAPCVSLATILGVAAAPESRHDAAAARRRTLVLKRDSVRAACPVQDVHGIHHFSDSDLKAVPDTLAKSATRYSTNLIAWNDRTVGVLDAAALFITLKRSFA